MSGTSGLLIRKLEQELRRSSLVHFSPLVPALRALLATGSDSPHCIPIRLVALVAIPNSGNRRTRRFIADLGRGNASGAALGRAVQALKERQKSRLCFEVLSKKGRNP